MAGDPAERRAMPPLPTAEDQDVRVRAAVYDGTIEHGAPPLVDDLAAASP
jgi:hypothetical protein